MAAAAASASGHLSAAVNTRHHSAQLAAISADATGSTRTSISGCESAAVDTAIFGLRHHKCLRWLLLLFQLQVISLPQRVSQRTACPLTC